MKTKHTLIVALFYVLLAPAFAGLDVITNDEWHYKAKYTPDADGLYSIRATATATEGHDNPSITIRITVDSVEGAFERSNWGNNDFSIDALTVARFQKGMTYDIEAQSSNHHARAKSVTVKIAPEKATPDVR